MASRPNRTGTEQSYRLSIDLALEKFRAEIEYALEFVDGCHFVRRADGAERRVHYGPKPVRGALHIPSALFPKGVRVDGSGIGPDAARLPGIEAGAGIAPLLPPTGKPVADGRLGYDAIGLVFHQLSRLEERDSDQLDRYQRYPMSASLAASTGSMLAPLADRAAFDVARLLTGDARPKNRTSSSLLLTHDVDRIRGYHRAHQPARYALGDLLKRRNPRRAWQQIALGYLSRLPWSSAHEIMELSEKIGQQSHFYFMGPTMLGNDSPYVVTMPKLTRRLARAFHRRGHVVGFHPGYATATDPAEWSRQRRGLEKCIGMPVSEGRQHTLRYQIDRTPDIWDAEAMTFDCTLSYPEASGFRSGTCRQHRAYSLRRRASMKLVNIDTAVMDFGLLGGKYRDLTIDEALAEAETASSVCRRYGGTLCVLYHLGQPFARERNFYRQLIELVG